MKKIILLFSIGLIIANQAYAQFSFYPIDNFENGKFAEGGRWWRFGEIKAEVERAERSEGQDLVTMSTGNYVLHLSGKTSDWYVGGVGTYLGIDAAPYSRFQVDVSGNGDYSGKLVIELYEDDNGNYNIEKDPKSYLPLRDDKWVAEITILGHGFTRYSIPCSAFRLVNPGVGDGIWNPDQKNGSGGLVEMQLVAIANQQKSVVDFSIDNILLTY